MTDSGNPSRQEGETDQEYWHRVAELAKQMGQEAVDQELEAEAAADEAHRREPRVLSPAEQAIEDIGALNVDASAPVIPIPPQTLYGVSIFYMSDESIVVHMTGTPNMGQIQRLLAGAIQNVEAEIVALKVVEALQKQAQSRRIIKS